MSCQTYVAPALAVEASQTPSKYLCWHGLATWPSCVNGKQVTTCTQVYISSEVDNIGTNGRCAMCQLATLVAQLSPIESNLYGVLVKYRVHWHTVRVTTVLFPDTASED